MYADFELRQIPLSVGANRRKVERFLDANGLRMDKIDYYVGLFACGQDEMLAGGGLCGDTIKCIAVDSRVRDESLCNRLVSHLLSTAVSDGFRTVKVFTKPVNQPVFESLGFDLLAVSQDAIFMENGQRGLSVYVDYLKSLCRKGNNGVVVMNANPFSKGHRYLVEQAASRVDTLYVIAVKEDLSQFSYAERLAMIKSGCEDLANVVVCEGSDYAVSEATFPSYFLKEINSATDAHIALDLDLFVRHIAPALQASVRFVGTEPSDALTSLYNNRMKELLPRQGIQVVEIARLEENGVPVSASRIRMALSDGSFRNAFDLAWPTSVPYMLSMLATMALKQELDTTPKPGLVDCRDNGAHADMDHSLMAGSIEALRPYFVRLAAAGWQSIDLEAEELLAIGREGEMAMLDFTSGVNTHKGALFSIGLTVAVASQICFRNGCVGIDALRKGIADLAQRFPEPQNTHGCRVKGLYKVNGALANACAAYPQLFEDWLPFFRAHQGDEFALHKTLLRIMSSLDDTNIYFRRDAETAERVRRESAELLGRFSVDELSDMNKRFIRENISPGGSADMLALTLFINSITN